MRTMYRITAARPFTGKIGPVPFVDGRTETDHEGVVAYCRRHGYKVEPIKEPQANSSPSEAPEPARPVRSASKGAWVAYAVSRGMPRDEAEAMTRDQLATHYHGEEEGA